MLSVSECLIPNPSPRFHTSFIRKKLVDSVYKFMLHEIKWHTKNVIQKQTYSCCLQIEPHVDWLLECLYVLDDAVFRAKIQLTGFPDISCLENRSSRPTEISTVQVMRNYFIQLRSNCMVHSKSKKIKQQTRACTNAYIYCRKTITSDGT